MTLNDLEQHVADTVIRYERETGHAAIRTREMIQNVGVVEALSKLMVSADLQQGFRVLRDKHLLNHTFEHIVVHNPSFFKPDIVECAQWRLDNPNRS